MHRDLVGPPLMLAAGSSSGYWPCGQRMLSAVERRAGKELFKKILARMERPDLWLQGKDVPDAFDVSDEIQGGLSCMNLASDLLQLEWEDAYYGPWSVIARMIWPVPPPPLSDPSWQSAAEQEVAAKMSSMSSQVPGGPSFMAMMAEVGALSARIVDRRAELREAAVTAHSENTREQHKKAKGLIMAGRAAAEAVNTAWCAVVSSQLLAYMMVVILYG